MTVSRYLKKPEEACIISRAKQYNVSSKRTLKKNEKQFVRDNGFILACSQTNQLLVSHLLENAVYNELVLRCYDVKIGKTYKGEIDFVAMKDGKKCFIQVAYLLSSEEVIEREFGAYKSIKDNAPKYVLSLDRLDIVNIAYQAFYSIKTKDLKTIAEFKRQKTIGFLLHYEH